jgi:hypothetical protein
MPVAHTGHWLVNAAYAVVPIIGSAGWIFGRSSKRGGTLGPNRPGRAQGADRAARSGRRGQ